MHASDLQSDVAVSNGVVSGTLKYVTDYTGFSSDPAEQSGNYVALKFEGNADTVKVKMEPSYSGGNWSTLDADRTCVFRVHDTTQKIIVQQTIGSNTVSSQVSLSGLTLEQPNG